MRSLHYPAWWLALTCIVTVTAITLLLAPLPAVPKTDFDTSIFKHIVGFCGLVGWFCGIFERRHWMVIVVGIGGLAFVSEWLQLKMAIGRVADVSDLVANLSGILLGLFLSFIGFERWAMLINDRLFTRKV